MRESLKKKLKLIWLSLGDCHETRKIKLDFILDAFYRAMAADLLIGFFFDGKDVQQIASKQSEFLMRAMGASLHFNGESPATAHLKLPPILKGHFDRRIILLRQTLHQAKLDPDLIENWIEFEEAFRPAVQS